jgi:hypothetical protein
MSEPTHSPAGNTETPSGTTGDQKPKGSGDLDALLAKNAELLAEKKKLQQQVDAIAADAKKRETTELAEKERYKELWEQTKTELDTTKQELFGFKSQITDARKFSAFQKTIGQAIPEKFHPLVDIDKIAVDETSGLPDEMSVKKYASAWQEQYGDLFKKPAGLPQDYPNGDGSKVPTMDEWKKLNVTDPKKARELLPLVVERHGNNLGRT